MTAIERAVEICGSQSELARRIGVKPQAVQQWVSEGRAPLKRVVAISKATKGEISIADLAPDFADVDGGDSEAAA